MESTDLEAGWTGREGRREEEREGGRDRDYSFAHNYLTYFSNQHSVTLDDLEAEERERMLCPCLDFQVRKEGKDEGWGGK